MQLGGGGVHAIDADRADDHTLDRRTTKKAPPGGSYVQRMRSGTSLAESQIHPYSTNTRAMRSITPGASARVADTIVA